MIFLMTIIPFVSATSLGTFQQNDCVNLIQTCYTNLSATSSWAPTIINLVPGFFALSILGIGIAVCYGALQDAGVV